MATILKNAKQITKNPYKTLEQSIKEIKVSSSHNEAEFNANRSKSVNKSKK